MPITQELQTAQRLQKAGLSPEASAVIAEKLEEAATLAQGTAFDRFRAELRSEMGALRSEMGALRQDMRSEMGALRQEMREEIGALRQEMRSEMGALRVEVSEKIGEVREKVGEVRVEVAKTRADLEHSMRVMQGVLLSAIALAVAILLGAPAILARFLGH